MWCEISPTERLTGKFLRMYCWIVGLSPIDGSIAMVVGPRLLCAIFLARLESSQQQYAPVVNTTFFAYLVVFSCIVL